MDNNGQVLSLPELFHQIAAPGKFRHTLSRPRPNMGTPSRGQNTGPEKAPGPAIRRSDDQHGHATLCTHLPRHTGSRPHDTSVTKGWKVSLSPSRKSPAAIPPLFPIPGTHHNREPAHETHPFAVGLCPTSPRASCNIRLHQPTRQAKPHDKQISRRVAGDPHALSSVWATRLTAC